MTIQMSLTTMAPESQHPLYFSNHNYSSTPVILSGVVLALLVIIMLIGLFSHDRIINCLKNYRKKINRQDDQRLPTQNAGPTRNQTRPPLGRSVTLQPSRLSNMVTKFTYRELYHATQKFSVSTLLGEGRLGRVHKGVLPNGMEIAVKKFTIEKGRNGTDFQAMVDIVSMIPYHKHIISLVGYCVEAGERLLVYEFLPNKTLEFHLHGRGRPTMDWPTRTKIALGVAKGLKYLHQDCHPNIVHGDIKASNIIIDHNFEAKVTDFGFTNFVIDNINYGRLIEIPAFGYFTPEYISSGKITDKSDVFSFGVVLLQLITGRRPVNTSDIDSVRALIRQFLRVRIYDQLVDPRLKTNFNAHEMKRMIKTADACLRYSTDSRPRMSQVVEELEFGARCDLT